MNKNVLERINKLDHTLKWRDIEKYCEQNKFSLVKTKKCHKVNIGKSVWIVHLEHRSSDELKQGILNQFKRILIKEKLL